MPQVTTVKQREQRRARRAQPAPSIQLQARRTCAERAPSAPRASGRSRARRRAGVSTAIQLGRLGSRPSSTFVVASPSQRPIASASPRARAHGNTPTARGLVTAQRRSRHAALDKASTPSSSPASFPCQFVARALPDTFGAKRVPNSVTARSVLLGGTSQTSGRRIASLVRAATAARAVPQCRHCAKLVRRPRRGVRAANSVLRGASPRSRVGGNASHAQQVSLLRSRARRNVLRVPTRTSGAHRARHAATLAAAVALWTGARPVSTLDVVTSRGARSAPSPLRANGSLHQIRRIRVASGTT